MDISRPDAVANAELITLLVTGAAPLMALAASRSLDQLLGPNQTVMVPDMVQFEVTVDSNTPGAKEADDWLRARGGVEVRLVPTEVFAEYRELLEARPATKLTGRGERAAAEVLSRELSEGRAVTLLFQDADKLNFLVPLPDSVLVKSTSDFVSREDPV